MRTTTGFGTVSPELQAIIDNTKDLMFVKNLDFVYVAASASYALDCVKCGGVGEILGKTDFDLFADRSIAAGYRRDDLELLESGQAMAEYEEEYPDRDGVKHQCLVTKYILHDAHGEPAAIFGQYHDLEDAVERAIAWRRYEAGRDLLTGLLNRQALFKVCRQLLTAHPEEHFVMVHYDIRQFHLYNTFYGDEAGNQLLIRIANLLRDMDAGQKYRAFGRLQSDVFGVFFAMDEKDYAERGARIYHKITTFSDVFPLEPMVGVYHVTDPTMSVESMFARATMAAKSGKNNLLGIISVYDDALEEQLQSTQRIVGAMHQALTGEEFEVYLQPKYSLQSEEIVGAEALVRWNHPEWGMVSPGQFIPIFEKNGFIIDLDRYMWEKVCRKLRDWKDAGRTLVPVSVNISRVSMYSRATVPFLIELVEEYGIEPKYLELELTETAYMDDPEDLTRMLRELREYGFTILMDDFGSGYSSLNTLRNLPVDILKLDRKFIQESQEDDRGQAILSSIIQMSKVLGLPVVAEGVEEKSQADYLCNIGCEYAQGFLFAKPMTVSEFEAALEQA